MQNLINNVFVSFCRTWRIVQYGSTQNHARHQKEKEMNAQLKRVLDKARLGGGVISHLSAHLLLSITPMSRSSHDNPPPFMPESQNNFSFYFITGKAPAGDILKMWTWTQCYVSNLQNSPCQTWVIVKFLVLWFLPWHAWHFAMIQAKYLPKIEIWSVDYAMLLSKICYHIHALMSTQT
jgi:hypothetical protein